MIFSPLVLLVASNISHRLTVVRLHAFGGGGLGGHPVFSLGVLSSFARWTCFSRVPGNMFTARVGKAHRRGSEREGGIIHDGARSGTRERGSEHGEAARSCTSGRGAGDAGPAGMMRVYAHPRLCPRSGAKG